MALVKEQLTIMQESFIDALAQQQATLKDQYQQLIRVIHEELRNVKALTLENLTPPANEIEPSPSNANLKPVIVAQPIPIINLIPIIKSKKFFNSLIFNKNQNNLYPFITKLHLKLLINYN